MTDTNPTLKELIENLDFHFTDDDEVNISLAIHCQQNQCKEGEKIQQQIMTAITEYPRLKERSDILAEISKYCIGKSTVDVMELIKRGMRTI